MKILSIDIETYSSVDLKKSGVYKYAESPDFEILLLAYSIDFGPVVIIENNFEQIIDLLLDPSILKTAFNANFERTCLHRQLKRKMPPEQWQCTMIRAAYIGLPLQLDAVTKVLNVENKKDSAGKALIRFFTMPCAPTKTNGGRTRNLPHHAPEKWESFKNYNIQDVKAEQDVLKKVARFELPDTEKKLWILDQKINDMGILLDPLLIEEAISIDTHKKDENNQHVAELTGIKNPNSLPQLKEWLKEELDLEITSLNKEELPKLIALAESPTVKEVLTARQAMAKTSVKKYEAMRNGICNDNRIRGIHQFYGANRTGRWAGRQVQPQNMPRITISDLDLARTIVKDGDGELLELLYGNVPSILSQLIRTAFVPTPGRRLIVSDFSAIEARVIAWLANEKWRLDVFNTHGKIYEASAAQMFNVPIETVTKGSDLRQKGKVSELALGYQGAAGALITMGALSMGISEDELPNLVTRWRNANKAIVNLWKNVQNASYKAVREHITTHLPHGLSFFVKNKVFFIELPSGRRLAYPKPILKQNAYGSTTLHYLGMSQTINKWCEQETYGGKLVENITQAIARDCLAGAMLNLDDAGYDIVMHVHDENVLDVPEGKGSIEDVNRIMSLPHSWSTGLPLKAESFETYYYKKD